MMSYRVGYLASLDELSAMLMAEAERAEAHGMVARIRAIDDVVEFIIALRNRLLSASDAEVAQHQHDLFRSVIDDKPKSPAIDAWKAAQDRKRRGVTL